MRQKGLPVAVVLVVLGGRVHNRAGLHADLLKKVPHLLVNILLEEKKGL